MKKMFLSFILGLVFCMSTEAAPRPQHPPIIRVYPQIVQPPRPYYYPAPIYRPYYRPIYYPTYQYYYVQPTYYYWNGIIIYR